MDVKADEDWVVSQFKVFEDRVAKLRLALMSAKHLNLPSKNPRDGLEADTACTSLAGLRFVGSWVDQLKVSVATGGQPLTHNDRRADAQHPCGRFARH